MRRLVWMVALLVVMAAPAVSHGKRCTCPCPDSTPSKRKSHGARQSARAPQGKGVASHPIAGGKSAEQAVSIEFEKIYKVNHLLKKGLKDYFSLTAEPGTEITLSMKSLKKSDAQLDLVDPKGKPVSTLAISGEANEMSEVKRTTWRPLAAGRYLVTVGSSQGDVGKDIVIFQAKVAPVTIECAAGGEAPIPMSFDTPHEDCFWKENTKDSFQFEGVKRDAYRIEIVSPEVAIGLQAKVGIVQKKKSPRILMDVSGSGGRVAIESVVLPKKGTYSLEVGINQASTDIIPYTVTFTRLSGPQKEEKPRRVRQGPAGSMPSER